jgi:hypothetical protein
MNRLSFGSASCYVSIAAFLGLAGMVVSKLVILNTPPGGTGDMTGIDHLGWGILIYLLMFASPACGIIGFVLGGIGSFRKDLRLSNRGMTLNGLAIVLAPVVAWWAFLR